MKRLELSIITLSLAMALAACGGKGSSGSQSTETTAKTTSEAVESSTITDTLPPDTTLPETTTVPATTAPETTTDPDTDEPEYVDFSDALFIGDSRTAGLYLYGRIDGARYFARTSMNVFNCFNNKPSETGTGNATLSEYLSANSFGTIYILLGINEIGYPYDNIIGGYEELVDNIRELQPEARIVIQSNMHVTKAKSDANPNTFNNERIATLNERLATFCEENGAFFLDCAAAFNDAAGDLDPKYSRDGVHFNVNGYHVWRDWLKENGLV